MIEQILMELNDTVQLSVGGKLTKFGGHNGITENRESFYLRKFLAVRYVLQKQLYRKIAKHQLCC